MSPVPSNYLQSGRRKLRGNPDPQLMTEVFQKDADVIEKGGDIATLDRPVVATLDANPSFAMLRATPTATPKAEGQNPLSSLAVQLILASLAGICFLAVFARCVHANRQHRSVVENRRRILAEAAVARANLHDPMTAVPTNERTLAGRLRAYEAAAELQRYHYPYRQGERSPVASTNSFVAPSYDQDVSPPPFVANSGKPPTYEETVQPTQSRPQ
ncbi:hypothetical protein BGW38_004177 [Lunasporangiospora selenospora]|uniref:Transmembrane protein n=1 Tax=Lunasporangiospora selenospora TaxID=979761 RepID=A0A9P6FQI4_9FUNG|nr:hypothetical protein BGW38_004177 [Lunasporangiospora selenospora]